MLDDKPQKPTLATASTPEVRSVPSPLEAIRAECLACCGGSAHEVKSCISEGCPLWPLRFGRRLPDATRSIVRAIRAKCLDCSGDGRANVAQCSIAGCDLHPFRFGKNPNRSRTA
jgi:hypothetical protein